MVLATLAANLLIGYGLLGLLFGIPFVIWGVGRVDPVAHAGTWGFRLLILPGVAAFWPWFAWRWARGKAPGVETNAHRKAARTEEEHT